MTDDQESRDVHRIQLAQSGDREALESLAQTWRPAILRYVLTMVGDSHLADDLCQETFRRAFANITDLRQPSSFRPWLYTIAVNLCRAALKRRHNHGITIETEASNEQSADRRSVLSSIVRRESAEALALAIDRLPILLREAFVLHLIEGLSYAEMQTITDAGLSALQVRTHRAKALLRRQLGPIVDTCWLTDDR